MHWKLILFTSLTLLFSNICFAQIEFIFEPRRIVVVDGAAEQFIFPNNEGIIPLQNGGKMYVMAVEDENAGTREVWIESDDLAKFKILDAPAHLDPGGRLIIRYKDHADYEIIRDGGDIAREGGEFSKNMLLRFLNPNGNYVEKDTGQLLTSMPMEGLRPMPFDIGNFKPGSGILPLEEADIEEAGDLPPPPDYILAQIEEMVAKAKEKGELNTEDQKEPVSFDGYSFSKMGIPFYKNRFAQRYLYFTYSIPFERLRNKGEGSMIAEGKDENQRSEDIPNKHEEGNKNTDSIAVSVIDDDLTAEEEKVLKSFPVHTVEKRNPPQISKTEPIATSIGDFEAIKTQKQPEGAVVQTPPPQPVPTERVVVQTLPPQPAPTERVVVQTAIVETNQSRTHLRAVSPSPTPQAKQDLATTRNQRKTIAIDMGAEDDTVKTVDIPILTKVDSKENLKEIKESMQVVAEIPPVRDVNASQRRNAEVLDKGQQGNSPDNIQTAEKVVGIVQNNNPPSNAVKEDVITSGTTQVVENKNTSVRTKVSHVSQNIRVAPSTSRIEPQSLQPRGFRVTTTNTEIKEEELKELVVHELSE